MPHGVATTACHNAPGSRLESGQLPSPPSPWPQAEATASNAGSDHRHRPGSGVAAGSPATWVPLPGEDDASSGPLSEPLSTCVETPFQLDVIRPLAPPPGVAV